MKSEYDGFPLELAPESAMSAASITKAFLDEMRITPPVQKFKVPDEVYGRCMQAYYGRPQRNSHSTRRGAGCGMRYDFGISIRCRATQFRQNPQPQHDGCSDFNSPGCARAVATNQSQTRDCHGRDCGGSCTLCSGHRAAVAPCPRRRTSRRVGHGLRRLVVIGSDGFVSLALR